MYVSIAIGHFYENTDLLPNAVYYNSGFATQTSLNHKQFREAAKIKPSSPAIGVILSKQTDLDCQKSNGLTNLRLIKFKKMKTDTQILYEQCQSAHRFFVN